VTRRIVCLTLVSGALAVLVRAEQSANPASVPLSDPARPPTLKVQAVEGSIMVRGSARRDVLISGRERGQEPRSQAGGGTGLRRLPLPPALAIEEVGNQISLVVQTTDRVIDLDIQVPSRTNLKLATANNGEIVVDGVEGDLEITNANGAITLTKVGGSIVANSVNDRVKVTVTSVSTRPMAFSSLVGDVDVTFPASLKANLKLRSDHGTVLTDFDLIPLQPPTSVQEPRREGGRLRIENNRFIYGAVNGGGPEIELRTFNGNVYVRRGQ
jgi:hypothetical protein